MSIGEESPLTTGASAGGPR